MKSTKRNATAAPLSLSVQYATKAEGLPTRTEVRKWVRATHPGAAELTVRFVDAEEGRSLNAQFRGKDYATNVLTFGYAAEPQVQADLVLCASVVEREALAARRPLQAHYAHLLIHGALHAQGLDHERAADAAVMEAREVELLAALGHPNPYRVRVPR